MFVPPCVSEMFVPPPSPVCENCLSPGGQTKRNGHTDGRTDIALYIYRLKTSILYDEKAHDQIQELVEVSLTSLTELKDIWKSNL